VRPVKNPVRPRLLQISLTNVPAKKRKILVTLRLSGPVQSGSVGTGIVVIRPPGSESSYFDLKQ